MRADQAYDELMRRVRDETLLTTIEALLEWDEETYMPPGGVENRSEQLALVAGLLHERGTDPRLGDLLAAVESSTLLADPASPATVNVRVLRREYDRFVRLPRALVEDVARTTVLAQRAWSSARSAGDFGRFRPWLDRIVELKRAEAECVGYADEPYDALLEDYEPGLRSAVVGRLFDALRHELLPLADRIAGARRRPDVRGPAPPLSARPPAPLRRSGGRRRGLRLHRAAAWTSAATPRARASARATAASPSAPTIATSPADCSRYSTRSGTGSTSRGSIPSTTVRRWARPPRSAWTSRRPGSGRTGWAGTGASGITSILAPASSSPRAWATSRSTNSTSP